ncbi:unnamed protein product, partial [Porites evermanni]
MVSGEAKDVIVAEASAHFNLQKQIIVFQDGTEVPYTLNKGIKYPYKAKASEKLYLLHVSEKGDFMVSGERKDVIVAEASAHFNLRKQIIVFQDGTEVPYTRDKGIKYPYKAKASEKLYLLHVSERRDIPEDQWSEIFISHDMCHVDALNVAQKALHFHPPFDNEWLKANKIINSLHTALNKSEGCK